MNIDEKIEELRKEFNNKIDELKEGYQIEKSGKWIPREDETYYYVIMDNLSVDCDIWYNDRIDNSIIKYNRIFKTKEEAQEYADYLKARKEYSYEFSKEEWENSQITKYIIFYDYANDEMRISDYYCWKNINSVYFKTEKKAQEFIDKYRKQILKFEFDIEE